MNKKKKNILIVILVIAFLIFGVYLRLTRSRSLEGMEQEVNIIKFESESQTNNEPTSNNYGNEVGNGVIVDLNNRNEFLDSVSNLDYGLSIINSLSESFNYLALIAEYNSTDIETYYNTNSNVINTLYGIKEYSKFESLLNDIKGKEVKSATIDIDTIVENDNIFEFTLILESENDKVNIPIKALAKDNDDMLARLYFYN